MEYVSAWHKWWFLKDGVFFKYGKFYPRFFEKG